MPMLDDLRHLYGAFLVTCWTELFLSALIGLLYGGLFLLLRREHQRRTEHIQEFQRLFDEQKEHDRKMLERWQVEKASTLLSLTNNSTSQHPN